jgi:hypothetical protein
MESVQSSPPESSWPGCCYDHYVSYLREPAERYTFASPDRPSLQILRFARVFSGCQTFCSVGMERLVAAPLEVCTVVDAEFASVPAIMAEIFFMLSTRPVHVCWGTTVRGIDRFDPDFVKRTGKNALYFGQPNFLPPAFEHFRCGEITGRVWSLLFISEAEFELVNTVGPAAFERRLEQAGIDPFAMHRPSIA